MKKRILYCRCGHQITIYHKGKHRAFVCPDCGVVATNPIPFQKQRHAIGRAITESGIVGAVPIIGGYAQKKFEEGVERMPSTTPTQHKTGGVPPSRHYPSCNRLLNMLQAERMIH